MTDILQSQKKGKGKAKAKAAALPSSLNFFGDRSATTSKPVPEEDDEVSEAESSSAAVIEPPKQKITITGPDPLPTSLSTELDSLFSTTTSSPLKTQLLRALKESNIQSLWGVQCAVGGSLIADFDTMCVAPTGSGKTLSYLLPTLVRLETPARKLLEKGEGRGIRSLIVVPTHDLAVQIYGVLKAVTSGGKWRCMVLSKATQKAVCESAPGSSAASDDEDAASDDESTSSVNEFAQKAGTGLGIDVLISTPERLHHLLEAGRVSLAE